MQTPHNITDPLPTKSAKSAQSQLETQTLKEIEILFWGFSSLFTSESDLSININISKHSNHLKSPSLLCILPKSLFSTKYLFYFQLCFECNITYFFLFLYIYILSDFFDLLQENNSTSMNNLSHFESIS